MTDNRRANEAGYGYGREAEMQARYGPPAGGYTSGTTTKAPMTDDLPQLVQRLREGATVLDEPFHRAEMEAVMLDAATALDTLTRALADQRAENAELRRDLVFHADCRPNRREAERALAAMTQERDEAIHQRDVVIADLQSVQRHDRATLTAAVREARAETWEAAEAFASLARVPALAEKFRERATAARAGQP